MNKDKKIAKMLFYERTKGKPVKTFNEFFEILEEINETVIDMKDKDAENINEIKEKSKKLFNHE
jgi:predicted transcriptional regulator